MKQLWQVLIYFALSVCKKSLLGHTQRESRGVLNAQREEPCEKSLREWAICMLKREASEETISAANLILDLKLPEL